MPLAACRLPRPGRGSGRGGAGYRVRGLRAQAAYAEQIRSLVKETLAVEGKIERTGEVYRADDVHARVERLACRQDTARPTPWRR